MYINEDFSVQKSKHKNVFPLPRFPSSFATIAYSYQSRRCLYVNKYTSLLSASLTLSSQFSNTDDSMLVSFFSISLFHLAKYHGDHLLAHTELLQYFNGCIIFNNISLSKKQVWPISYCRMLAIAKLFAL